jgi:hypothetical protein
LSRAARLAVGLLLASSLAGCSLTHFFYNRADYFVVREVGQYLTLTAPQEAALRGAVIDWQDWHREQALPTWQIETRALAADLQAPMDVAAVTMWGQRIDSQIQIALDEMMIRLVPLIGTLSDEQIAEFWVSFDDKREDRRDDAPEDVDALADRAKQWMKRWAGRPDATQAGMIAAWSETNAWRWSDAGREQAANDEARQRARVEALLLARQAPDALDQWRRYLSESGDDSGATSNAESERVLIKLLADLSATLNPRQRDKLVSRVEGYAELFAKMAVAD